MVPVWYRLAWRVTAALFAVFLVAYHLGAAGVKTYGSTHRFDRQFDHALFEVDHERALLVHGKTVSLVRYRLDPLFFICGCWVPRGIILRDAQYQSGDWMYTDHPEYPLPAWHRAERELDAVNLRTGETIDVDIPEPPSGKRVDPVTIPAYARNGLVFDPRLALTPERVAAERPALFAQKESCVGFVGGFYLAFLLLALTGAFFLARHAWRGRAGGQPPGAAS